jgi:hypothetical protein
VSLADGIARAQPGSRVCDAIDLVAIAGVAGTWIGEYRGIHCQTNTGARCETGERGWARLVVPGAALAPAFVLATVELGVCTSGGTVRFGEPFSLSGSLEPRRSILSGLRESRHGTVQQSTTITWATTILSSTEMVGGILVSVSESRSVYQHLA